MNLPKVFQNNNIKTDNISQNVFYSEKDSEFISLDNKEPIKDITTGIISKTK